LLPSCDGSLKSEEKKFSQLQEAGNFGTSPSFRFDPGTQEPKGLFSWQIFWRNVTVAVSLLFGKYCPIMV
jgi:hypothetical protein